MTFTVEIAVPPSANNIYANVAHGRAKTSAYAAWRKGAAFLIRAQVRPSARIGGPVAIEIEMPRGLAGDLDNRLKPSIDCLVASGRIDDDRNVVEIVARKNLERDFARITVRAAA